MVSQASLSARDLFFVFHARRLGARQGTGRRTAGFGGRIARRQGLGTRTRLLSARPFPRKSFSRERSGPARDQHETHAARTANRPVRFWLPFARRVFSRGVVRTGKLAQQRQGPR